MTNVKGSIRTPYKKRANRKIETTKKELRANMKYLSKRYKEVMIMRHGLGGSPVKKCSEIAAMWGITKQRVEDMEKRAFKKIRLVQKNRKILNKIL